MKLSTEDKILRTFIYIFLLLLGFAAAYPFWNSLVISFNSGLDTSLGGITFWPRQFTLDNYRVVFADDRLLNSFGISVLRTLAGTSLSIFFTGMLGYGLSKKGVAFYKFYMLFFIFTMFFSGGLIPSFVINRSLGLTNSFWIMIIPFIINIWNMIIFRSFFREIPDGLEESAKLDGCSNFGVLFRIIVPISGPVIATLSLFVAVFHWNDWLTATIYINKQGLMPIQSLLQQVLNSNLAREVLQQATGGNAAAMNQFNNAQTISTKSLSMAIMIVATLPIIVVYPFLQRFFVKGVTVGSLKG
ncbi:carbohydrate ABC transporter permease [Paenibacillus psychroresistens]|uniref:Carbohydrate ABC transporter permease n=1 Tax=Paenibacillus psychroresistens TaxID=1778678 RepID=A0A6B8RHW1_9BACL|nr:carbohydrate ABC transporter permease [Paenibacillus psychroresistens]QGQ95185.1 carbohydrate ABC transporter permease [Paenibacillus psychroresistens]